MKTRKCLCAAVLGLVTFTLVGCAPKLTIEQLKAKPERPAALDKLKMFAGDWEGTSTMTFAGIDQKFKSKNQGKASWHCDGRVLVEHSQMDTEELGKYEMMGIWVYDAKSKKYRNYWFSSAGEIGESTAHYNDETKTWKFKGRTSAPWGSTMDKGTAEFVSDNKMEWSFTSYGMFGLKKMGEIKGTSIRTK